MKNLFIILILACSSSVYSQVTWKTSENHVHQNGQPMGDSLNVLIASVSANDVILFDVAGTYQIDRIINDTKTININAVPGVEINYTGPGHCFVVTGKGTTIKNIKIKSPTAIAAYAINVKSVGDNVFENITTDKIGAIWFESLATVNYNSKITNLISTGAISNVITTQYVNFLSIFGGSISGGADGIKFNKASSDVTVSGIEIKYCNDDLIDMFGGGRNVIVDKCKFEGGYVTYKNGSVTDFKTYINGFEVKNSTFKNATIQTFGVYNLTQFSGLSNLNIHHNKFENSEQPALVQNGSVNYKFTDNKVFLKGYQMALNLRPGLGESLIQNNLLYSDVTNLITDESKGVYMVLTSTMSDGTFGIQDDQAKLILRGNTVIGGRRSLGMDGVRNFEATDNTVMGAKDSPSYQMFKASESKYRPNGTYWHQDKNIVL